MVAARIARTWDTEFFYRQLDHTSQQNGDPHDPLGGIDPLISCPGASAWLDVTGTPISYPVVEARGQRDVSFWLSHRLDGEPSAAGCLVLDERSEPDAAHIMVYGHRMGWSDAMFGSLWQAYQPSTFTSIGTANWYTAGIGWISFEPLCALTISAHDAEIQRFAFTDHQAVAELALETARRAPARCDGWEARARGTWRILTLVTCTQPWEGTDMRTIVMFCAPRPETAP